MAIAIKAVDVCKSYVGREIIKKVSFDIEEGDFVALVGESGAGKSTLLYLLSGIERLDGGQVIIDGVDIGNASEKQLASMRGKVFGFVFQFDNLLPNLTILDNILLPLVISGDNSADKRKEALELLEYMSIAHTADKTPAEVSGGEQQRASIVRALIIDPKILFLDEPTGSLDSESSEQINLLLRRINEEKGVTIVLVTHSARTAETAKRVITVKDGMLINA